MLKDACQTSSSIYQHDMASNPPTSTTVCSPCLLVSQCLRQSRERVHLDRRHVEEVYSISKRLSCHGGNWLYRSHAVPLACLICLFYIKDQELRSEKVEIGPRSSLGRCQKRALPQFAARPRVARGRPIRRHDRTSSQTTLESNVERYERVISLSCTQYVTS